MRLPGLAFPRDAASPGVQVFGFPPPVGVKVSLLRQAPDGGAVLHEEGRAPVPAADNTFGEFPDALPRSCCLRFSAMMRPNVLDDSSGTKGSDASVPMRPISSSWPSV